MTRTDRRAAADTAAMRAEADQLDAAVREDNRSVWERAFRARQLAYEADLIDAAEDVRAEHEGAMLRLRRLEAEVPPLIAAERAAEDRLRADQKRLGQRSAGLERARKDNAPGERREDLAVRVRELGLVAGASREALAGARRVRELKEAEVARQEAHVTGLYGEMAEAVRAAANPGVTPNRPMLAPGVTRISDLGEEERQYLVAMMMMAGSLRSEPAPARPGQNELLKDQAKFRTLSLPGGRGVIVPPRLP